MNTQTIKRLSVKMSKLYTYKDAGEDKVKRIRTWRLQSSRAHRGDGVIDGRCEGPLFAENAVDHTSSEPDEK